jgi:transposase
MSAGHHSPDDLAAHQWSRICQYLELHTNIVERRRGHPPKEPSKRKPGRPPLDIRRTLNGILWGMRTGRPWRDLPERYGSWYTVASCFYRWRKSGVWYGLVAGESQVKDNLVLRAYQNYQRLPRGKRGSRNIDGKAGNNL